MKKTAIILTLGLVAIIAAVLLCRPANEFDRSKHKPILFPPQKDWPTNVLMAIQQFRAMPEANRIEQGHEFKRFVRLYEYRQDFDNIEPSFTPLLKDDVKSLFGVPDGEFKGENHWFYRTEITDGAVSCMDFYFNRNKLSAVCESVGSLSSPINDTSENIYGSEQGGPGYPPQGVGSPDP